MFIVYPLNIDYLIDDVRLKVGDYKDNKRYSDNVIRSAIVGGIKMLQRKWGTRYFLYQESMNASLPSGWYYYNYIPSGAADCMVIVPSGYQYINFVNIGMVIPSGLVDNDVVRNPSHPFSDPYNFDMVISQDDEYIVVLAAAIILFQAYFTSSIESFQSWTDGNFSFSNITAGKSYKDFYDGAVAEFNSYFKQRLHRALVGEFRDNI